MVARTKQGAGRRRSTAGLTGCLTGCLTAGLAAGFTVGPTDGLGGATPAVAAAVPGSAAPGPEPRCRVVRLAEADHYGDGGVTDLEVVDGRVVYYGSGYRFDRSGQEHQRAFVWFGLRSEPVRVGPRGYDHDIAFEVTSSGLVNGSSENDDGSAAQWVQDLGTGEISYFDVDSGPRGDEHGWTVVRRVNAAGAAAGMQELAADPGDARADAIAFDSPDGDLRRLAGPPEDFLAYAWGINDGGDRAGFVSDGTRHPDDEDFLVVEPRVWRAGGGVVELDVHPEALDASVRAIADDGGASGEMSRGDHPSTAHLEAAYWPDAERSVGLGVLPGGTISVPFGMDEGGTLVGLVDRAVGPRSRVGHDGYVDHGFLWSPALGEGAVRILPSRHGVKQGTGWRTWAVRPVHAVDTEVDQAGASSHWRFDGDRPVFGPTVWLGASTCGVVRPTTHDPFGLDDPAAARTTGAAPAPGRSAAQWRAVLGDPVLDPRLGTIDRG